VTDEWAAGYRAGLAHAWAKPRRAGGLWSTPEDRDSEAPDGSSPEFIDGWRTGLRGRH